MDFIRLEVLEDWKSWEGPAAKCHIWIETIYHHLKNEE